MRGSHRWIIGLSIVAVGLTFLLIVVNQTAGIVQLATTVHPDFGRVTLVALLVAYVALISIPFVLILRLPRRLVPPETDHGAEFERHLQALGARLATNPRLTGSRPTPDRSSIELAIQTLDAHADNLIKAAATGVFLSTAVSQNGRLDGLLVLAAQSQLVWRIAHLYSQRPGPGELTTLYANVAATTFVVGELQDIDLSEQVEPIISSALGSLGGSVPGLRVVSTILVNSVTSGAANAFLTLRVGMIAKKYCGALVAQPRDALRRSATAEAARLLGGIVTSGSRRLTSAVMQAAGSRVADAASVIGSHARSTSGKLWSKLRFGSAKAPEPAPGSG